MAEVLALIQAVVAAFAPIVAKAVERGLAGGDPLSVLEDERPGDIIPSPLKLQAAEAAARARVARKP